MSIKYISCIPVWIFSPAILGDVSVEHEERFHLDLIIATMRNDIYKGVWSASMRVDS